MHICMHASMCVCVYKRCKWNCAYYLAGSALPQCHRGKTGVVNNRPRQWITRLPCSQANLYLEMCLSMVLSTSLACDFRVEYQVWLIQNLYSKCHHRLSPRKSKQYTKAKAPFHRWVTDYLTKELGWHRDKQPWIGICITEQTEFPDELFFFNLQHLGFCYKTLLGFLRFWIWKQVEHMIHSTKLLNKGYNEQLTNNCKWERFK